MGGVKKLVKTIAVGKGRHSLRNRQRKPDMGKSIRRTGGKTKTGWLGSNKVIVGRRMRCQINLGCKQEGNWGELFFPYEGIPERKDKPEWGGGRALLLTEKKEGQAKL